MNSPDRVRSIGVPGSASADSQLRAFLDHGLHAIAGWGIDDFLAQLFLSLNRFQELSGVGGNLFEIGVHHGRSAVLLALMTRPGERAVFMDLFDRQDENLDASGLGDREIFEQNLRRWAPDCAADVIQTNTLEADFAAIPALRSGVRFAHIDGGHYREVVLNDLLKTEPLMCDGGIVVLDDFCHMGFPEVSEACHHYLEADTGRLVPVALGHNKLVLTTRNTQARLSGYLQTLGSHSAPRFGAQVKCHGYPAARLEPQ
jgi:hypothetical protein